MEVFKSLQLVTSIAKTLQWLILSKQKLLVNVKLSLAIFHGTLLLYHIILKGIVTELNKQESSDKPMLNVIVTCFSHVE